MAGNNDSAVWCLELHGETPYWRRADIDHRAATPHVRAGHSMVLLNETAMVMTGGAVLDAWGGVRPRSPPCHVLC